MNERPGPYKSGYRVRSDARGYHTIVKLRHPEKTLWQALKDFINNLKINEEFTRKEVLNYIYLNNMYYHESTTDKYRNQLTHIGILKWSIKGRYTKLKNIPEKLNTVMLKKLSNESSWESWFIPVEMID